MMGAIQHFDAFDRSAALRCGCGAESRDTKAHGRYILPLDVNDLIGPTMLEKCAVCAGRRTGGVCVYTDGRTLEMWIRCEPRADTIGPSQILQSDCLLQHVQKSMWK